MGVDEKPRLLKHLNICQCEAVKLCLPACASSKAELLLSEKQYYMRVTEKEAFKIHNFLSMSTGCFFPHLVLLSSLKKSVDPNKGVERESPLLHYILQYPPILPTSYAAP